MKTPIKQFFDEIIGDTKGIGVNVWGDKNAKRSLFRHEYDLTRNERYDRNIKNKKHNKVTEF